MNTDSRWLLAATTLCIPLAAAAQVGAADPLAPVTGLPYRSAWADYKPWRDLPAGDWKALNEAVKAAADTGHSGHAVPASPGSAPAPAGREAVPAPPPPGGNSTHGGHR